MKNLVQVDKFEVIGLEARDRVGGRVFTDANGNEIGAAWIHGTDRYRIEGNESSIEENPVYTLAKEIIPEEDLFNTDEFIAVSSDGSNLSCDFEMWDNMWKALNVIKQSKEAQENAFKATDFSVYDFIFNNFAKVFEHVQGLDSKAVIKTVIEWQSYYATLWDETSIGSMAVDKEFDGDQLLIKNGGYTRILNHYLDYYNLRHHIRLNSPVERIERLSNGKSRVHIKDADCVENVDIVVVTVPLGVLKKRGIVFDPPLPEEKQAAIDRLGFGTYDKVFVTFADSIEQNPINNEGFWIPGAQTISIVPKADDDYEQYLLAVNPELLEGKDPETIVRRPYHARDENHIGIEMANISEVAGVPKLVMLIYGPAAEKMESLAHDNVALTDFARSKLENAFPDRIIPRIIKVEATTWGRDQYSYGSFAHIPLGSSGQDMITLSQPIEDKILFAGEATFPLHYSTVHGALKSGRREFARIMKIYFPEEENEFEEYLNPHHL